VSLEDLAGDVRPNIIVSHLGFLCDARKRAVFPDLGVRELELQDLEVCARQAFGAHEDWAPVFRGPLTPHQGPMGRCLVGDFSAWRAPGQYRLVLPRGLGHSHPFTIQDGLYGNLPGLFLDYLHQNRCGPFRDAWRGPCHLDDGILTGDGGVIDATGGWHDAGDTRKWMAHTSAPILGLCDLKRLRGFSRRHWAEPPWPDDLLAEVAWGVDFVLRMQDPATGMFYEDVGGGGDARMSAGMSWWYENHAGCGADNSENRFTDNLRGSGDERPVRRSYNPVVQYVNVTVLARAATLLGEVDGALGRRCRVAAERCLGFMASRVGDAFHGWTSVRSWRLLALLALSDGAAPPLRDAESGLEELLALHDPGTGFFWNDVSRGEPYRGILHSAQPLLALAEWLEHLPNHARAPECRSVLERCFDHYLAPLLGTNPFGIVPYGLFRKRLGGGDVYHPWRDGLSYRFFMPTDSEQKIVHGLAGHWTSWAHALAACGRLLGRSDWIAAAADQLAWLLGANPLRMSLVTGVGYNQPVPHSRFFGPMPGGFSAGPRGDAADQVFVDQEGRLEWSSTEYWVLPIANTLSALARLIPSRQLDGRTLGHRSAAAPANEP
jgi:hypothetical protein